MQSSYPRLGCFFLSEAPGSFPGGRWRFDRKGAAKDGWGGEKFPNQRRPFAVRPALTIHKPTTRPNLLSSISTVIHPGGWMNSCSHKALLVLLNPMASPPHFSWQGFSLIFLPQTWRVFTKVNTIGNSELRWHPTWILHGIAGLCDEIWPLRYLCKLLKGFGNMKLTHHKGES